MPRRPLTRLCPNHPSSFLTSQRGRPRLPGVPLCTRRGALTGVCVPGGRGAIGRAAQRATHTDERARSRVPAEQDRPRATPTPPGPPPPRSAPSPAADPAQPRRPRPRANLPRPRYTYRPARPQRRSGPGCPGRRARRLRTVTATEPSTEPGPSDTSEPPPQPDRRLFSSASNRHRPPRAPRPAAPRPPGPGSGQAGPRTHGPRGRARCPLPGPRPGGADSENSLESVCLGASPPLPAVLPHASRCAPSPGRLPDLAFREGIPELLCHCGGRWHRGARVTRAPRSPARSSHSQELGQLQVVGGNGHHLTCPSPVTLWPVSPCRALLPGSPRRTASVGDPRGLQRARRGFWEIPWGRKRGHPATHSSRRRPGYYRRPRLCGGAGDGDATDAHRLQASCPLPSQNRREGNGAGQRWENPVVCSFWWQHLYPSSWERWLTWPAHSSNNTKSWGGP